MAQITNSLIITSVAFIELGASSAYAEGCPPRSCYPWAHYPYPLFLALCGSLFCSLALITRVLVIGNRHLLFVGLLTLTLTVVGLLLLPFGPPLPYVFDSTRCSIVWGDKLHTRSEGYDCKIECNHGSKRLNKLSSELMSLYYECNL